MLGCRLHSTLLPPPRRARAALTTRPVPAHCKLPRKGCCWNPWGTEVPTEPKASPQPPWQAPFPWQSPSPVLTHAELVPGLLAGSGRH